ETSSLRVERPTGPSRNRPGMAARDERLAQGSRLKATTFPSAFSLEPRAGVCAASRPDEPRHFCHALRPAGETDQRRSLARGLPVLLPAAAVCHGAGAE